MDARLRAVARQLLLVERELRDLGWWASRAPEPAQLASSVPFCADTLAFEAWLQWVLLPRMKVLIERGSVLPANCSIRPMAEVAWMGEGVRVARLLAVLGEFDRLLGEAA